MNVGSYFEIPVTNLSRAIAFYSEAFNLEFSLLEIHGIKMALFSSTESGGISGGLAQGKV